MNSETMQSDKIGNLIAALCAVSADVGAVRQTGYNSHHRYAYTSDDDLAGAVGPALAAHGVSITPCRMRETRDKDLTSIVVTWRIAHTSGEWITCETVGSGSDKQDKGAYKAQTGARKYALRLALTIASGDDAERDAGPSTPRRGPEPDPEPARPKGQIMQYAASASTSSATLTRWAGAINAIPDRLLPVIARRLGDQDASEHADSLDKLAEKYGGQQ